LDAIAVIMNDHLSDSQILRFQARDLPTAEMIAVLEHLAQCLRCRQRSHARFQGANAYQASVITLSPARQWHPEHLHHEQVKAFVNQQLDNEEQEITQVHLQTCLSCRAEVDDWRLFEQELQTDLRKRFGPKTTPQSSWSWKSLWPHWEWKPVFAATGLIAVGALTTLTFMMHLPKQQTSSPNVVAIPAPTINATPFTPTSSPAISPTPKPEILEETMIASVQDEEGVIGVTKSGKLTGLVGIADGLQDKIQAALRTAKVDKPTILHDLANEEGVVRGKASDEAPSPMLTPRGITVLSQHPMLQWQPMKNAIGYEVQIADGRGNQIAQSEILPATSHRWQPSQALSRGKIFTWMVRVMTADDRATATLPTGRFKVLDATKARELSRLKAQTNSHLVLGMFYAREGMLPEARQELKSLAQNNPHSPLARKLSQTVQRW
jgi:hypothetical protein